MSERKASPPYFPFYQRDFVHSCRSERMSADEIGALVMVMCQQWETMGPIAVDPARFAAYTGWDVRVARRLLARLVEIKKVEIDARGIQSSRMQDEITKYVAKVRAAEEREAKKRIELNGPGGLFDSEKAKTSGELPGEVLEKFDTSSGDLFQKSNDFNGHATTETPLPDSDSDSDKKEGPPKPPKGGVSPDPVGAAFEVFWKAFPDSDRKHGKGECAALFRQLVTGVKAARAGSRPKKIDGWRATVEELLAGVRAYAVHCRVAREFIPAPATWLNQGRWLDLQDVEERDPEPVNGKAWGWWRGKAEALKALPLARWEAAIEKAKPNGTWPWWILTAPPGHPECLLPMELQGPLIPIYQGKIQHG